MKKEIWLRPGVPFVQDDDYFSLSQDSVLLAAFAKPAAGPGMDLCCGQGPLGLLCFLRTGLACDGLELQPGAADMARENYARAGMAGSVYTGDLRALPGALCGKYKFVLCNPPYFEQGKGKQSPKEAIALARGEAGCTLREVSSAAAKLLQTGGTLHICLKPERLPDLLEACRSAGLEPKRLRLVHHKADTPAVLALLEARKGGGVWLDILPPLIVAEPDGRKTAEWNKIYGIEE